jgi:hypothetical protein
MHALYLACIVPVMTYGADIWWRGKDSDAAPLREVQNSAMMSIMGGFRTFPSAILHNEAAIPYLATMMATLQH